VVYTLKQNGTRRKPIRISVPENATAKHLVDTLKHNLELPPETMIRIGTSTKDSLDYSQPIPEFARKRLLVYSIEELDPE
jgi:hypothetical protein